MTRIRRLFRGAHAPRVLARAPRPRELSDELGFGPSRKDSFGEAPKPAREARALPGQNRFRRYAMFASLLVTLLLASIWFALPKPPLLEGIEFSTRVRDRNGTILRVTLTPDQKYRIWTPLREISPALIEATVQFEDKYFARHPGVNPVPLIRAGWNLVRSGRKGAGASTITMQLARLRYRLHTRTLAGKFRQIVYALELERWCLRAPYQWFNFFEFWPEDGA